MPARGALLLLLSPSLLMTGKIVFLNPVSEDMRWVTLPDGEAVFAGPADARSLQLFERLRASVADDPEQFIVAMFRYQGGGFNHFYNPHFPLRNYLVTDAVFRPMDEADLVHKLPSVSAFVLDLKTHSIDDAVSEINASFHAELATRILSEFQLNPDWSTTRYAVFTRKTHP